MDLEVKIKEEPAWLEGTTASLENFEHVSEVITLKEEIKSELTEPRSTQENSLEPSEGTKEEMFIEEHTNEQLLPYIKEETKYVVLMALRHFQAGLLGIEFGLHKLKAYII
ncbi:uncharacterized protein [Anabrus simplex]|uniref:uncharacterized protein n=1 Tax=Anabrus simplex TaxID=316456 RepID=UPI0035A35C43